MTTQLFTIGVALAMVMAASSADARRDIETQGPSQNGTLLQAGSTYARWDRENQGPSLNGVVFRSSGQARRKFKVEGVELSDDSARTDGSTYARRDHELKAPV